MPVDDQGPRFGDETDGDPDPDFGTDGVRMVSVNFLWDWVKVSASRTWPTCTMYLSHLTWLRLSLARWQQVTYVHQFPTS